MVFTRLKNREEKKKEKERDRKEKKIDMGKFIPFFHGTEKKIKRELKGKRETERVKKE